MKYIYCNELHTSLETEKKQTIEDKPWWSNITFKTNVKML